MSIVFTLLQMTEELTHPTPSQCFIHMNEQFKLNIGLQTFLPRHVLQQCSQMRCQHEVNGPSFSP